MEPRALCMLDRTLIQSHIQSLRMQILQRQRFFAFFGSLVRRRPSMLNIFMEYLEVVRSDVVLSNNLLF
jgi:hypothetical protein